MTEPIASRKGRRARRRSRGPTPAPPPGCEKLIDWKAEAATLNELYRQALPIECHRRPHHSVVPGEFSHPCDDVRVAVANEATRLVLLRLDEAGVLELIEAAQRKREAYVKARPTWGGMASYSNPLEEKMLRLAWPDLQAWIAADNARRLAMYEQFRAVWAALGPQTPTPEETS